MIRRIIFLILIIVNCITIYYFSNQGADMSKNSSGRVVDFIARVFLKDMDEVQRQEVCEKILQPLVRKTAHFTLYAFLGFFTMNFMYSFVRFKINKGQGMWISQAFGSFYALTDEIHQFFIEGRSCELLDVCIDSLGVFTGILLAVIIINVFRKIFKSKNAF